LTRPDGQKRACYTVCRGQDSGFVRTLTVIREVIDKTKEKPILNSDSLGIAGGLQGRKIGRLYHVK